MFRFASGFWIKIGQAAGLEEDDLAVDLGTEIKAERTLEVVRNTDQLVLLDDQAFAEHETETGGDTSDDRNLYMGRAAASPGVSRQASERPYDHAAQRPSAPTLSAGRKHWNS